MSLLEIKNLSHTFGDQPLYKNAQLTLNKGEHIGIVGQNGVGKSTLIKICTGQMIPDEVQLSWQPRVTVGYLDQYADNHAQQTIHAFLESAFAPLFAQQQEMNRLYDLAAAGDNDALAQAADLQQQLEQQDFYQLDARIQRVATGLGLDALGLDRPIAQMSGGQRVKVILAKLLLEQPDVLLLDEPTNFLDVEHVQWLADYLAGLPNAFLVVSHDTQFLEKIANHILDIDNGQMKKYYGSYSEFLKKKAFLREDYLRQYTAQQKEINKAEEFIRRNKAGQNAKMARGRQKQLDRLDRIDALEVKEIRPNLDFQALPLPTAEALRVKRLTVGYTFALLPGLSFTVKGGEKAVITGFNGIGKSTLLKTLLGQIPALGGSFAFNEQAVLGYLEQNLTWPDSALTPVQFLAQACPALTAKEVRGRLARCGISSKHALQAIGTLSGGEQAKVRLSLLTCTPCNLLILDEPTNHLDAQAKEALQAALRAFSGTVLLVSHEESFYRDWVHKVISIERMVG